jgi:CheY-like chemotaxis protein
MLLKEKRTILIVDDDVDYLFQMRTVLQGMGYEVISADSRKEAEAIISQKKPDLALLDLMMESHDTGFVLCYLIKNKYPDVPIIITSAVTAETGMMFDLNNQYDREWIKADAFLDKGIRYDQLQKEIEKLLKV